MNIHILRLVAVLCIGTVLPLRANAQIFSSTGGVRLENAQSVGEPNVGNGRVFVKKAPTTPNRIAQVKNDLRLAQIPARVTDTPRFLGEAGFARQISDMWAVKQTAKKLRQLPNQAPTGNGAIIIGNANQLKNNRGRLKDNSRRTFVFRNRINVPFPILVGSNKTIWIDGVLIYNGVDVVPEGGAAFTPRPLKNDGVFSVRQEAKFRRTYKPSRQADRDFNRNLLNNVVKQNRKSNTTFRGTKRGKIAVRRGTVRDDKQLLPKANGIVVLSGNNITIDGVDIRGALNAIYISGSFNVNVRNCFTDGTVYRGIHLHGTQARSSDGWGQVQNNLVYNSLFDGIDIDSFSAGFVVKENVVVGARDRFLIWTEIDANNNTIDNNVGIVLPGNSSVGGGFQENGTESERRNSGTFNGTRENSWLNNSIFYASKQFDGFVMRKFRFVQFDTITFRNNYVWALNSNVHKHNPKSRPNNDVYFLIK